MADQVPPIVQSKVRELAAMPPGAEAQSKASDLLELLQAILKDPTVAAIMPTGWKLYVAAGVVVLALVSGFLGRQTVTPIVAPQDPALVKKVDESIAASKETQASADKLTKKIDKALTDPTPVTLPVAPPIVHSAKVTPANPKSGELVVITVEAENVLFDFDGVFPTGAARQSGKELTIALPKADAAKTYTVKAIYCNGGKITIEKVEIKADGGSQPPDAAGETIKQLKAELLAAMAKNQADTKAMVDSLASRVTALEGAKPPPLPPANAVVKHVTFIGPEVSPVSLAVNNDAGLRTTFKAGGISVHVLKKDDPNIAAKGLQGAVDKAGGLPCWVGQDDLGHVIAQGPMQSAAAVLEALSPFMKR